MSMDSVEFVIEKNAQSIAETAVARQYAVQPEIWEKYGEKGRELSIRDVKHHLVYLKEAISAESPQMFINYTIWLKDLFSGLDFPDSVLPVTLECMRDVLTERLPEDMSAKTSEYIEAALRKYFEPSRKETPYILKENPHGELAAKYLGCLLKGNRREAEKVIFDAVESGAPVQDIYLHVFQASQYEIGRLWHSGEVSVAQEHYCSAVTERIMSQLYPEIFSTRRIGRTYVGGCVGGELHQIGARMVADFFEADGWDTVYLGANAPASGIIEAAGRNKADILGISCTMSFHRSAVEKLVNELRGSRTIPKNLKIIVGGYMFLKHPDFYKEIGADGTASNAAEALETAKSLVKQID